MVRASTQRFNAERGERAFTLIEMSIVLVIIGLIVAGVLVGRDLIRSSTLLKTISEVNTYNTAVTAFREKYGNLPGDMPRAVANTFFDFSSFSGSNGACDGSPNGVLLNSESICFWVELSLAKMSAFRPRASSCTALFFANEDEEGYTAPQSRYSDAAGFKAINTGGWWTGAAATNRFLLASRGGPAYGCAYRFVGGAVTPKDAYDIDIKIDDGSPNNASTLDAGSGESPIELAHRVTASNGASLGSSTVDQVCYTGASYPTSGTYNVSNTARACILRFLMSN